MQAPQPAGQMPAPSHQETVAAVRHFMAIVGELKTLLNNPAIGKSDMKGAIIDGTSKLVAERMLTPGDAVIQLAGVPDDPAGQRKWAQSMLQQTIKAQNNVIDHHVAAHAPTLDWNIEKQHQAGSADDHMQTMESLGSHYR